mmetsp:Transcript_66500/g.114296  ORF Transcript_66500/g.114296 Transcript_66500/m.114296 type:complete len:203 (-) Transcript_66500:275-883(-)
MPLQLVALVLLTSCSAFRVQRTLRVPTPPLCRESLRHINNGVCGRRGPHPLLALPYEPSPLDPNVIYSQIVVIGASLSAFSFWWFVTVPNRRKELALEKRNKSEGSLGGYLDELRSEGTEVGDAATSESSAEGAAINNSKPLRSRAFEQWLFSDWLNQDSVNKERALPFLPKAKFNSGDNPIIAATALIMGTGVVFSILGWT